jgi:phage baseplate assembly protein W
MSIGVKLPLTNSDISGYTMTRTIRAAIKQNFKMLLLTNPGERVMEPDFGVGLISYLFKNYSEDVPGQIRAKIIEQTSIYMPVITLVDIDFGLTDPDTNKLAISITYKIPDLGATDLLELTI